MIDCHAAPIVEGTAQRHTKYIPDRKAALSGAPQGQLPSATSRLGCRDEQSVRINSKRDSASIEFPKGCGICLIIGLGTMFLFVVA